MGILLALALAAFLVVVPLAKILVRRARMARAGRPRELVLATFHAFTGRAADLGLGRRDGETIREYRDRLCGELEFSDGHMDRLSQAVATAAYSDHDLSTDQARDAVSDARQAIRDIRRHTPPGRRLAGMFRLGI